MQKVELGVDVCFICAASTSIGHPACLGAFDQLLQLKAELGKDKDVAKTLQHPVISFIFFLSCWSSPCFRSLLSFFSRSGPIVVAMVFGAVTSSVMSRLLPTGRS